MVSSSIIYTLLFTMGFLLFIDSMHAASVHSKDDSDDSVVSKMYGDDQEDAISSFNKRSAEHRDDFDDYQGILLGKRQFALRGIRLPSESILLGKRRLPVEAVLLGRRDLPNEGILLGKRR